MELWNGAKIPRKKKRAKINRNFNLECFVKVTEQPASKRELIHTVSAIGH